MENSDDDGEVVILSPSLALLQQGMNVATT
jgi:hypothetical protein